MARYKFEQIAINSTEKKKPVEEDRFTYVGLEHLDPGSLKVTRFGSETAPVGEKLVMHKGDVLFGKRRAYQKKVSIAPFDGIFSAHGMVLRPKEDIVDKNFFPLFISSDYFLDEAIRISVGSLSPTINWRDLKELEFELPDLEEQRKLAEVLWAINDAMEAYKKLISATEELVKSRFIEMFGDPEKQKENLTTLGEHINLINGYAFKGDHFREDGIPVIKIGNVNRIDFHAGSMQFYDRADALERFVIKQGDLLISLTGTAGKEDFGNVCIVDGDYEMYYLNQRNAKLEVHDELNPIYLLHLLRNEFMRKKLIQTGTGIRQCHLHNKDIEGITFLLPPIGRQEAFAVFVRQSDKSKYELEQALLELTATYKRIVAENLG